MRILVTRAREDAERTAQKLTALGHETLIAPVLQIVRPDGSESLEAFRRGSTEHAVDLGREAGTELRKRMAAGFLDLRCGFR